MNSNLISQYISHLDSIVQTHDSCIQEDNNEIPDRVAYNLLTRSKEAIEKIGGKESYYSQQSEEVLSENWAVTYKVTVLIGIVEALRDDIKTGFLVSFSELVRGEVFQNFLDMAEYLCQESFKDAAAVIAGSTLEAHLKQLCNKNNIDTSSTTTDSSVRLKKASQLNQELGKVAYSLFDQKQVTAWLDLRNSAAHGKYNDYSIQQVRQFIEWLKDFTLRNPA
jgi:hypothetical protein